MAAFVVVFFFLSNHMLKRFLIYVLNLFQSSVILVFGNYTFGAMVEAALIKYIMYM